MVLFQRFEPVMVVEDNKIHIMWLLPQYAVVTVGEILFSITSMEFAYSQAPPSMKSVLQVSATSQLSSLCLILFSNRLST